VAFFLLCFCRGQRMVTIFRCAAHVCRGKRPSTWCPGWPSAIRGPIVGGLESGEQAWRSRLSRCVASISGELELRFRPEGGGLSRSRLSPSSGSSDVLT
jgi:hypothetical protein